MTMSNQPAHPSPLVRCTVSDLPLEVLGEIFLRCLPPGKYGSFSARDAPWLLTKVCRSWREVVLSMPLLWSKLPFLSGEGRWEGDGHLRLLKLHLENSAGTALALELELTLDPNGAPFLPLVIPHLSQSQHLSIRYHEPHMAHVCMTHKHFPLLKSLELACSRSPWAPQNPVTTARLEGIEFPWAQLTQLTIQVSSSAEALALLIDCRSLEVCRLSPIWQRGTPETPHGPLGSRTVHPRLRALIVEDGPFSARLLGCLVTPALSALEFIQHDTRSRLPRFNTNPQSILLFIRNSSARLTSLTLHNVKCSPRDFADISALIPMATELVLQGSSEKSLQSLAIKSNSPYGVLFPRLKRLVIRSLHASESVLLDIFHSRLFLAPNPNIIENTAPLQHAELYIPSVGRSSTPTYFGESYQDSPELRGLILQLQRVFAETAGLDKEISGQAVEVIHRVNRAIFPKQGELGYCEETLAKQAYSPHPIIRFPLPPLPRKCFFQKLDAAFAALEGYRFTHAAEILINGVDTLIHAFSCVPKTAFLHHPTFKFHMRATRLLERWQPILSEYKAKDKWICEYDPTTVMFKLVYRRAAGV